MKVLLVPESKPTGPINHDNVLFIVPDLHNCSCLVPFGWMVVSLILELNYVTDVKRLERM